MPYYNPNASGLTAAVTDNLQPIAAPVVGRYFTPRGKDHLGVTMRPGVTAHNHPPYPSGILFVPIVMAETITADRIGFMIRGAATTIDQWSYTLGLYTHNAADNYPDTLITSYGQVLYQNGSFDGPQLITINQQFNANQVYWVAFGIRDAALNDANAGMAPAVDCADGDFPMFRKRGASSVFSAHPGVAWLHSFNAFNGTLPSSVTYAASSGGVSITPRVSFRRSA